MCVGRRKYAAQPLKSTHSILAFSACAKSYRSKGGSVIINQLIADNCGLSIKIGRHVTGVQDGVLLRRHSSLEKRWIQFLLYRINTIQESRVGSPIARNVLFLCFIIYSFDGRLKNKSYFLGLIFITDFQRFKTFNPNVHAE